MALPAQWCCMTPRQPNNGDLTRFEHQSGKLPVYRKHAFYRQPHIYRGPRTDRLRIRLIDVLLPAVIDMTVQGQSRRTGRSYSTLVFACIGDTPTGLLPRTPVVGDLVSSASIRERLPDIRKLSRGSWEIFSSIPRFRCSLLELNVLLPSIAPLGFVIWKRARLLWIPASSYLMPTSY